VASDAGQATVDGWTERTSGAGAGGGLLVRDRDAERDGDPDGRADRVYGGGGGTVRNDAGADDDDHDRDDARDGDRDAAIQVATTLRFPGPMMTAPLLDLRPFLATVTTSVALPPRGSQPT